MVTPHSPTVLQFAQSVNRTLRAEITPTIATPGIRVTINPNTCMGDIMLYVLEQSCPCTTPSQCPCLPAEERNWSNFPCSKAPLEEQMLAQFVFGGANHPITLITGMAALDGVDLKSLPIAQRAALEVLREAKWAIDMARKDA